MVNILPLYSAFMPDKVILDFLNRISKKNDLFYVTHRPLSALLSTEQYFKKYNFPCRDNLCFERKEVAVRAYDIEYFVEDLPRNVDKIKNLTQVFMVKRPWNRYYKDNKVIPINHVTELEGYLDV